MPPAATPGGYLAAGRAFERAWQAQEPGRPPRHYCFAGHSAQFRVAGSALAEHLHRPFAHLAEPAPAGAPGLAADVWEAGGAAPYSEPPVLGEPDEHWQLGLGTFSTYCGRRYVRVWQPNGAAWLDRTTGRLVGWRQPGLPIGERSKPLQHALYIWYHDHDVQVIHAGLIARNGRGVLVGGPAGSGKSTTTLACLLAGFQFLSDDHIGLQAADGAWLGRSIYGGARIEPDHLKNFPALQQVAVPSTEPNETKSLVFLAEVRPEQVVPSAPVHAIVLPRVVPGRPARLRPAARADVVRSMGPSSLIVPLGAGAGGLRRLAQLAGAVPAYWLDIGPRIQDIPRWIETALERSPA